MHIIICKRPKTDSQLFELTLAKHKGLISWIKVLEVI